MRDFLLFLKSKTILKELLCYVAASIVIYVALSVLYPVPFTFPDSGSYVLSAYDPGAFNIYRPMGYSAYLSFLHGISPTMGFMTGATYFLHIIATLTLLFTARYFFKLEQRILFIVVAICALFAPTLLFATNFIMSDSVFASLSMLFLASAIWIVFCKNWWVVALHLLIFWGLYSVRFSGMFYVPISIIAMLFSPLCRNTYIKIVLAATPMVLFLALFYSTKSTYRENTGVDTFSAFNGWQLLNNASVLIPNAKNVSPEKLSADPEIQFMHAFFSSYPDSVYDARFMLSTSQMWSRSLPPRQFTAVLLDQNPEASYSQAWVHCGVLFQKYATELIANDFSGYISAYILPSAGSVFKNQPITEQSNDFKNEQMYDDYYGVKFNSYAQQNQGLWSFFNDIREVFNVIFWIIVFGGVISFIVTDIKSVFKDKNSSSAMLIVLFIIFYLGSSVIASPCTSWRYSLPLITPVLLVGVYMAKKIKLKAMNIDNKGVTL